MSNVVFTVPVSCGINATILTDQGRYTLGELTPNTALDLWRSGAPQVHITPYGAMLLLRHHSPDELIQLLPCCKTRREINALCTLHDGHDALRTAGHDRLLQLRALRVRIR